MEHNEHAEHSTDGGRGKGTKKFNLGKTILIAVGGILLIFFAFGGVIKKHRSESKQKETGSENFVKPYVPPHTVDITGNVPDVFETLPIGYNYTFVCDQPYRITDGNGNTYDGEANKDVSIGIDESTESTAKSRLKFNTRNNTNTKMTVQFNPLPPKKN